MKSQKPLVRQAALNTLLLTVLPYEQGRAATAMVCRSLVSSVSDRSNRQCQRLRHKGQES